MSPEEREKLHKITEEMKEINEELRVQEGTPVTRQRVEKVDRLGERSVQLMRQALELL